MACRNPIWRHNAKGQLVLTPCKTCHGCRISKISDFTNRFKMDFREYGYVGSFITLTYRDSDLPLLLPFGSAVIGDFFHGFNNGGATLYKKDLTNFFDNLNHKVKKKYGLPIRYIASGEYGDDNKRPHYHATIMGLPYTDRKLVYDTWSKGRIDIKPITNGAVSYVCGYIMSDVKIADEQYKYWGDFAPQFGLFSKGLGTLHFRKNMERYNHFGQFCLTNNGDKVYQLNDYYRKKFGFFSPSSFDPDLKKRADANCTTYFEQKRYEDYLAEERFIHSQRVKGGPIHDTLCNFDSRSYYVFDNDAFKPEEKKCFSF